MKSLLEEASSSRSTEHSGSKKKRNKKNKKADQGSAGAKLLHANTGTKKWFGLVSIVSVMVSSSSPLRKHNLGTMLFDGYAGNKGLESVVDLAQEAAERVQQVRRLQ